MKHTGIVRLPIVLALTAPIAAEAERRGLLTLKGVASGAYWLLSTNVRRKGGKSHGQ